MNFTDIKKGQIVRSTINTGMTWLVIEKKRGGWVLLGPTADGYRDIRFNVRSKNLMVAG